MKMIFALLAVHLGSATAYGEVVEKVVNYKSGGVDLEGFHAFDERFEGKRPGVLITHQWTGLSDYERMRARMLAELGYNVFAADVYGAGVRPQAPEAGEVSGKYKTDREQSTNRKPTSGHGRI